MKSNLVSSERIESQILRTSGSGNSCDNISVSHLQKLNTKGIKIQDSSDNCEYITTVDVRASLLQHFRDTLMKKRARSFTWKLLGYSFNKRKLIIGYN